MEITFVFICLPRKFGGLAVLSWSYLLSPYLWDSSARARSYIRDGDAVGPVLRAWGNWGMCRAVGVPCAEDSSLNCVRCGGNPHSQEQGTCLGQVPRDGASPPLGDSQTGQGCLT